MAINSSAIFLDLLHELHIPYLFIFGYELPVVHEVLLLQYQISPLHCLYPYCSLQVALCMNSLLIGYSINTVFKFNFSIKGLNVCKSLHISLLINKLMMKVLEAIIIS